MADNNIQALAFAKPHLLLPKVEDKHKSTEEADKQRDKFNDEDDEMKSDELYRDLIANHEARDAQHANERANLLQAHAAEVAAIREAQAVLAANNQTLDANNQLLDAKCQAYVAELAAMRQTHAAELAAKDQAHGAALRQVVTALLPASRQNS